jgi:hypothetical protein
MGTTSFKCCQVFLDRLGSRVQVSLVRFWFCKNPYCAQQKWRSSAQSLYRIYMCVCVCVCLDLNLLQVYDVDDLAEWVFCYRALMAGCRSWLKEWALSRAISTSSMIWVEEYDSRTCPEFPAARPGLIRHCRDQKLLLHQRITTTVVVMIIRSNCIAVTVNSSSSSSSSSSRPVVLQARSWLH